MMRAGKRIQALCAAMIAATVVGYAAPASAQYYEEGNRPPRYDDGYRQPSYDDGYSEPRYKPKRYKKYKPKCHYEYVRKAVYRDYKKYYIRVKVRRCY